MAALPSIVDFAAQAHDPARYARLGDGWAVAAVDVVDSTGLAAQGRDRQVNFVAGAAVAVLQEAAGGPGRPAACQFGGDGAVAAVPPDRVDAVRAALAALAHWAASEMGIPLRAGLVPMTALAEAGHEVLAALQDFGGGNVFGLFLGDGVPTAEAWIKAGRRWSVDPAPGALPGLDGLSCRWRPVAPARGIVLCLIVDPVRPGGAGLAALARVRAAVEAVVSTEAAAPLGDGSRLAPAVLAPPALLAIEAGTEPPWRRPLRLLRAAVGTAILGVVHRLGGRVAGVDSDAYRHAMARRCDYRKLAGGLRLVLDVTEAEAGRIEAALSALEAGGDILFGAARAEATTITCMVGDFTADRHIHFVDGQGLGFWRASRELKKKLAARPPAPHLTATTFGEPPWPPSP